jgi:hypothetical protein
MRPIPVSLSYLSAERGAIMTLARKAAILASPNPVVSSGKL